MRIGIFGGSFDPIHSEHFNLAKYAIQSLSLDKLIVIPAGSPPHKRGKRLSPDLDRLAMCRLAFAGIPEVEVSDYEIKNGGISYTYLTCEYFQSIYPNATFFWLVGTDMLRNFPTWKYPEKILSIVNLAVCARAENVSWLEVEQKGFFNRFQTNFSVIDYNGKDISSTLIRVLASAGEEISHLVGEPVARYIKENQIYEIKAAREALNLLKPERKAHSLRVAYMAAKRAPALGVDEKKAITAGLFHDCAKYLPLDHELLSGFKDEMPCVESIPAPVLHQFTGEYLARKVFQITDEDILNAIRYHTSGRENMSALERLIFLADMLEDERDFDGVEPLRKAFWNTSDDLTECMALALSHNLTYLQGKKKEIYQLTVDAENYYRNLSKKEKNI